MFKYDFMWSFLWCIYYEQQPKQPVQISILRLGYSALDIQISMNMCVELERKTRVFGDTFTDSKPEKNKINGYKSTPRITNPIAALNSLE